MEREILKAILEFANRGEWVTFSEDWGKNTLTVTLDLMTRYEDNKHTHCGTPEGTFDELVNSLYNLLVKGKGLSWG